MSDEEDSRVTYKEYQNTTEKKTNESLMMFVSAFFIMLLLFLAMAKQFSPDVDITIGDNNRDAAAAEKLQSIQDEDRGASNTITNDMFSPELDERVVIPNNLKKLAQKDDTLSEEPKEEKKPETKPEVKPEAKPAIPPTTAAMAGQSAKVLVGYYATAEQAQIAKGILAESGLNVQPFVRSIGGAYTIQAGSFSSREKAQTLVNELLQNNYPARIITE